MAEPKTTIPKGSWVLVTGATGFVACHVAKQFLERGYRVRGTVRDLAKATWLIHELFKSYADRGEFELALVPDLAANQAFDKAVKGVSAIAHVATINTFDPDPNKVVPQTVAGATSIMEAALREPSVQEFVYTSSFVTAVMPMPGNSTHVERDTWNDAALELAWAPPPYEPSRSMLVYMASKIEAEKAVWKFSEERKPRFTVNIVSPSMILGEPLSKHHAETSAAFVKQLCDGDLSLVTQLPAAINVNVKDVALLHVAAILDPEVKNARLQAWAQPFNWNDVLAIMRKLYPQLEFMHDLPNHPELSLSTDFSQPLALLNKWAHQHGWISLEETVSENMRPLVEWYSLN